MRRLTGGKSESAKEKARLRAASGGQNSQQTQSQVAAGLISGSSPRVPRVPLEYLNGNVASGSNLVGLVQQGLSPAGGIAVVASPLSPEGEGQQKSL